MQTFGAGKWPSVGDLVGEYDGLGAPGISPGKLRIREQMQRLPGHSYGHGRTLMFRIPRDRYGNFHPRILAILRHQEDECERLAGTLYTKGLTQEQVGEVFQDIYGEHYSKASISRMLDYLREDVSQWLTRSLEAYYPIVFIDCVHIRSTASGAWRPKLSM